MVKLFIFDLDGVLIDSCDIHYHALNDAISDIVGPTVVISKEDHKTKFNGLSTRMKLNSIPTIDSSLHDAIFQKKQEYTLERLITHCAPSERITKLITGLKDQGHFVVCASNCIRQTVISVLDKLQILDLFTFVLSNDDVTNPKPSPEIYTLAMSKAGVSADETIIFEDSYIGLRAAVQSGANVHVVRDQTLLTLEYVLSAKDNVMSDVQVVIPMAGNGSRFAKAGYKDPKPFIPVFGTPMISWVVRNLGLKRAKYTFLVQKSVEEAYGASNYLSDIVPGCSVILVDGVTEGAACTVLLAKENINNLNPLLIINSDQYIEFESSNTAFSDIFEFLYNPLKQILDGTISTFNGNRHPKWSYAKLNDNGHVSEVREKDPFSDHATTGLYMWRHGCDFVNYANQMISKNIRVNNEFYVVPVFNEAIKDGKLFNIFPCKKMWGLGVPEDLDVFLKEYHG